MMRHKSFIFLKIWIICMTLFPTIKCLTNQSNNEQYANRKLLQLNTGDDICKLNFTFIFDILEKPEKNVIILQFELEDPIFKDCFTYCNVFLNSQGRTIQEKRVIYKYNESNIGTCVFEDVSCGTYEIFVEPGLDKTLKVKRLFLKSDPIHMTSDDCKIDNQVIIFSIIGSVILIAVAGALIRYCCCSGNNNAFYNETSGRSINVYILYCSNSKMKKKVSILKDFLQQLSYYSSIKTIEDDLSKILINPYNWIIDILEKKDKDGNLNKIILIETEDYYEEEEFEMENFIFSKFIEKLNTYPFWCLSHSNVFVARLGGEISFIERLKHLVKKHHYHIPKNLTDLCLKLCIGSKFNVSQIKKKLKKVIINHKVKYLCSDQVV